jgi:hypothetical protein
MKINASGMLALAVVGVLSMVPVVKAAPITVISDTFTRGTLESPLALNGSSPDIGAGTWTASAELTTDGTTASNPSLTATSASLPFSTSYGAGEYRLSVQMMVADTDGEWVRLGFTTTNSGNPGIIWQLIRRVEGDNQFRGDQTAGDNFGGGNTGLAPVGTPNLIEIVLDTAPAQWTIQSFINGNPSALHTFTINPVITGVFLGGDRPAGVFDNLLVTAPEPASLGLLAAGGVIALARRRRA